MLTLTDITRYRGVALSGGERVLYLPPHSLLAPFVSHYCVSFPSPQTMTDGYTVLPSANSVLVARVKNGGIAVTLNGTSTKAARVGDVANKQDLLVLVKFRAGGFFHFCGFSQDEISDGYLSLRELDKNFYFEIENALIKSDRIEALTSTLDNILIRRLIGAKPDVISSAVRSVIQRNGNLSPGALSAELYYSEKHIRRLFLKRVGAPPKTFARIVRLNRSVELLRANRLTIGGVAAQSGYFDQPHLTRDFKELCGITPGEYLKNLSDFYNADSI